MTFSQSPNLQNHTDRKTTYKTNIFLTLLNILGYFPQQKILKSRGFSFFTDKFNLPHILQTNTTSFNLSSTLIKYSLACSAHSVLPCIDNFLAKLAVSLKSCVGLGLYRFPFRSSLMTNAQKSLFPSANGFSVILDFTHLE